MKYGKVVELTVELTGNTFDLNTTIKIGTIPTGFRLEGYRRIFPGLVDMGGSSYLYKDTCEWAIDGSGIIWLVTPANGFICCHITYFTL